MMGLAVGLTRSLVREIRCAIGVGRWSVAHRHISRERTNPTDSVIPTSTEFGDVPEQQIHIIRVRVTDRARVGAGTLRLRHSRGQRLGWSPATMTPAWAHLHGSCYATLFSDLPARPRRSWIGMSRPEPSAIRLLGEPCHPNSLPG